MRFEIKVKIVRVDINYTLLYNYTVITRCYEGFMAFTTQIFLFLFLPLTLIAYFLVYFLSKKSFLSKFLTKIRALDIVTIIISCGFYAWACFDDVFRLLFIIVIVYLFGFIIQSKIKTKENFLEDKDLQSNEVSSKGALKWLIFGVAIVVFFLIYYNYTGLIAQIWNFIFKDTLQGKSLIAPLGLSFIVFSSISYLVDVYRGDADAKSFIDCALYITFFPKVISGPIVLWKDFSSQITSREVSVSNCSAGILRVMIGFAKKIILADSFGAIIASAGTLIDVPTAWGTGLLYMLQIYFDFSGYSDIAIGLALMMGFSFKENFNFPYLSCSITEFWRRWHISLGTWFKQYVYIPLGGNRKGKNRTLINIAVVFLLTGIWHGAYWTYILWGVINGVCNCIEKLLSDNKIYQKTPKIIKWLITFVIVFFCWQIFRFTSVSALINFVLTMFGIRTYTDIPYTYQYYFDLRAVVFAVIGLLSSTVFGLPKVQSLYQKLIKTKTGYVINALVITILFVLAITFMVNSKYSPFIYFQY